MLIEQSIEKMRKMKLNRMATSFKERLERSDHKDIAHSDFVGLLIDDEYQERKTKTVTARLRKAKFKQPACLENVDYSIKRGLQKNLILELAQNQWIRGHKNIILTGPSGVGKSYLAQALGNQACREGYSVCYLRSTKLFHQMVVARAEGNYLTTLKRIAKTDVLIIDDFAIAPLEDMGRHDLFEIIEDRHQLASTIITSQMPTELWHDYLGGGMVADGVNDRILSVGLKIPLTGDSCRK